MPTTLASTALLALGLAMLAHAAYSAHEHSALTALLLASSASSGPSLATAAAPSSGTAATALPMDIAIETLVAVILLCCGMVAGAEPLRPIRWRAWAAQVDHGSLKAGTGSAAAGELSRGFDWVEQRRGFLDIRRERKEFADWVRAKGSD